MKKSRFAGLLIAMLMLAVAVSGVAVAGARGSPNFELENGTGRIIREIYLSPAHMNEWIYQDELGKNVLYPGQELFLDFDPRDNVQYWDIKVVYDNGDEEWWYDLDLFRIYHITIRPGAIASIDTV
ncbi:MAG: hypothetical protein IJS96_02810 [Schwartzia sp.]|nr:hypothetical protein [Schwartzia sp. (in: firmicutes)]